MWATRRGEFCGASLDTGVKTKMLLISLLKALGVKLPDSIGKLRPGIVNFAVYSLALLALFIIGVFIFGR